MNQPHDEVSNVTDDDGEPAAREPARGPGLSPEQRARVEAFAPRVPGIARSLRRVVGIAPDECESAGYEALARAALRYDPASGVPFAAFAFYRVRGAMIDAARNAFPDHKRARRILNTLEVTQELSEIRLRPGDDPRRIGERFGDAAELVREVTAAAVLSRLFASDDDDAFGPEVRLTLRALVERCDPDERALIDAVYVRGLTLTEVAADLATSVSTISRRHQRLLRRLADLLAAEARPPEAGP
ncbi:sigma-70 family RNA polymerase sigma factor [Nannocystis pusilla]|uniref:Sigma-70 family RNA polymerase sigma factor n=1 Tax=Nannocystis pusilla TaxID=889268 RepID=A0A9X3IXB3_9BACT|nr:sigma-70 family RNA polymerase sigma factor [Nannocystis pusilla]MCY1007286.1 sigma-70 family RNA polymerase sigma factor [Nannocystis pusilla]